MPVDRMLQETMRVGSWLIDDETIVTVLAAS